MLLRLLTLETTSILSIFSAFLSIAMENETRFFHLFSAVRYGWLEEFVCWKAAVL